MSHLTLDVRLDGFADPAGVLARDENGAVAFAYTAMHIARADALPLSLSLPLTDEPYDDVITRAFFDNLLQERDGALNDVMAREGLARDDIAGLMLHLGKDCPGALSVLAAGAPPAKVPGDFSTDYVAISDQEFAAIATALREQRRLPIGSSDPSPLAGVQSKIALTQLPDGRFAHPVPGSGAPTTHILKVPDRDHPRDASYEAAALDLSRALEFDTSQASVISIQGIEVLLVRRFDRALDQQGQVIRLHQEDFAQALGLPAALKYERRGTPERRFDVTGIRKVLDATIDPIGARDWFIRATLFDLMTGNVDGHAKNYAILHLARDQIRIAPRYDLLPTRLDPHLTDELAFNIGNAATLATLTGADFQIFLESLGVRAPGARQRIIGRHAHLLARQLAGALDELTEKRMKLFADLIAANLRQLMPALGLAIPNEAQERDAFVARGGGWSTS